jgi:hypothetical protein
MGLGQSSIVATGDCVRGMLLCPYQAEDLTRQNLPIRGLAVLMGESKFITKKVDSRVSVVEVVVKEDHLLWTAG